MSIIYSTSCNIMSCGFVSNNNNEKKNIESSLVYPCLSLSLCFIKYSRHHDYYLRQSNIQYRERSQRNPNKIKETAHRELTYDPTRGPQWPAHNPTTWFVQSPLAKLKPLYLLKI